MPVIKRAVEPVTEVIMAILPPNIARVTESKKAPNNPTLGSTPAIPENAIASGIIANATTRPARTSREGEINLSFTNKLFNLKTTLLLSCLIGYEYLNFQEDLRINVNKSILNQILLSSQ